MFFTILTSTIISAVIWAVVFHYSRIVQWVLGKLRGTRYGGLVEKYVTSPKSPVGNIYAAPVQPFGHCSGDDDFGGIQKLEGGALSNLVSFSPKKDSFAEELEKPEESSGHKILFINHRTQSGGFAGIELDFFASTETLSTKDAIAGSCMSFLIHEK
jgi:hypothetical protein